MGSSVQDLYVVCNWNDRTIEIISELRALVLQKAGEYPPISVITTADVNLEPYRESEHDRFRFLDIIRGDPGRLVTLSRAGAFNARAVIILADDDMGDRSDSKTLMTLLAFVRGWEKEHGTTLGPDSNQDIPWVMVEYLGQFGEGEIEVGGIKVADEFELFHRKLGDKLQVLRVGDIRSRIFAQAARNNRGGLLSTYDSLLTFHESDCESYICKVNRKKDWVHFAQVVKEFVKITGDSSSPIIPVAVRNSSELDTNPVDLDPSESDDLELVVISYDPPPGLIDLDSYSDVLSSLGDEVPKNPQDKEDSMAELHEPLTPNHFMQGHYIICHWNDRAAEIVCELRSHEELVLKDQDQNDRVPVVILTRKTIESSMLEDIAKEAADKPGLEVDKVTMDVYFRPGDPVNPEVLKQVNAHEAKSIVVLAGKDSDDMTDARTLQCLLALRKTISESTGSDGFTGGPHIVVEIRDVNNYPKFREFTRDSKGRVEVIRADSLRTRILAQAARTPGLVEFYYDLLNHDPQSNEQYELDISSLLSRVRSNKGDKAVVYPDLVEEIMDLVLGRVRKRQSNLSTADYEQAVEMIPIGVWREDQVHLNPIKGTPGYEIHDNDSLIVISYHPPSLSEFLGGS